ncbi:MAG: S1 RNA-binding domain-containing protein [Clostridia bacterium]|nr:S1 RNA-binding domain-containing protein [Clostridia bacterium]
MIKEAYRPEGTERGEERQYLETEQGLLRAREEQVILQARCTLCDSGHNLYVDLGPMTGYIPREETAMGIREGTVKDVAIITRVNKMVSFVVKDFMTVGNRRMALLSRREAQERCLAHLMNTLQPGMVVDARVTHLEQFGAFVDLGCGIVSMIPIDRISVSRIRHPDHRFVCGMQIKAVVLQVDRENHRFLLSHKELLGTWEENVCRFEPGQTVGGIIRSVESYGIFVELAPNLAGLAELTENAEVDRYVGVYIKSILPEKMKVKLAIVDMGDPITKPTPFTYYFKGNRLERWVYSPPESGRVVEELF